MRSLLLGLGLLGVPFMFVSCAAGRVGPSCCQVVGETHPPDPHNHSPMLLPADVRQRGEPALTANAEAPAEVEAPRANVIALPLGEPHVVAVPTPYEPVIAVAPDSDDPNTSPCCLAERERQHSEPPFLVSAEVRRPNERYLTANAEAPVVEEVPLVNAVALPDDEQRIVVPTTPEPVIAAVPVADDSHGAPCCQVEGEAHPPDPHTRGPILVPAEVSRRDERALTAGAEAPVEEEAPVADAIALPEEEPRFAVPTAPDPTIAADQTAPDLDIETPPCCRAASETEPPDPHSKDTPVLIGAEVKDRDERALEAAVELSIPVEIPLVNAIGIPLDAPRGVSEPDYRPTPVEAAGTWLPSLEGRAALIVVAILLLAICLRRSTRRRPDRLENQPLPKSPRYPFELLHPEIVRAPPLKPVRSPAKVRDLESV